MKIEVKEKDKVSVLELSGEVDFHSSPQLREKLQGVLKNQSCKILINLKGVHYIDSSGLATFVEVLQKIKGSQGQMVLTDLAPPVRSVFEIAKLDTIFKLAQSEEEAMSLLASH